VKFFIVYFLKERKLVSFALYTVYLTLCSVFDRTVFHRSGILWTALDAGTTRDEFSLSIKLLCSESIAPTGHPSTQISHCIHSRIPTWRS